MGPSRDYFSALARTLEKIDTNKLNDIIERLKTAKEVGATVFLLGNGGSAATASHAANDLLKMGNLRSICISDMTPTSLAYGNDNGWKNMFLRPIMALAKKGDIIIGISCSGNSPNIVQVAQFTMKSYDFIAITGNIGGELAQRADLCLKIPHKDIKIQEDCHLAVFHAIAGALNA